MSFMYSLWAEVCSLQRTDQTVCQRNKKKKKTKAGGELCLLSEKVLKKEWDP